MDGHQVAGLINIILQSFGVIEVQAVHNKKLAGRTWKITKKIKSSLRKFRTKLTFANKTNVKNKN